MKIRFSIFIFGIVLALILSVGLITSVYAAPAAPIDLTLTQPDGSTFQAR